MKYLTIGIRDCGCNLLGEDYTHSRTVNSVYRGLFHEKVIDFHRASVKEGGSVMSIPEDSSRHSSEFSGGRTVLG